MVQGNAAFANEAIIKSNATSENSSISEQEKLVKKELSDLMSEKNNLSKTDEGRKEEDLKNENSNKIINSIIWGASNNEKVEYFLRYFKTKVRERFKIWLSRSSKYLPLISKIFEEHGIAQELIFLPLIESGFSPYATSRAQAVGIWQFMKGTAIKYGLRVDKFVDERRDPEKSAEAAARYLKDLYNMFGSWDFALAAYNAGEGKIMRTMSSTGSKDFWDVIAHRKIKKETKEYVPRFVAATLIAKEPEEHGFDDVEYETNIEYEEVALPPKTTLSSIAKAIDVEEELIKNLNPSIKHGFLPPDTYYPVKVPKEKKELLLSKIHLLKTVDNKTFKKVMAMKEKKRFTKRKKAHKKIANAKRVNSDKRS
ncbi:MAG: hypothetical protein OHK0040_08510 [bacterium]